MSGKQQFEDSRDSVFAMIRHEAEKDNGHFFALAHDNFHSEQRDENLWYQCLYNNDMDEKVAISEYVRRMAHAMEEAHHQNKEARQARDERINREVQDRLREEREWEEAERQALPLVRHWKGAIIFGLIGCAIALIMGYSVWGIIGSVIATGAFGASLFNVVRYALVPESRWPEADAMFRTFLSVIGMVITGPLIYFFVF